VVGPDEVVEDPAVVELELLVLLVLLVLTFFELPLERPVTRIRTTTTATTTTTTGMVRLLRRRRFWAA
jgi:hypothetical protein